MATSRKPLKKGNYDGKIGGYDYRGGGSAGTYNLYKNNKYVKTIGIDGFRKLSKLNQHKKKI